MRWFPRVVQLHLLLINGSGDWVNYDCYLLRKYLGNGKDILSNNVSIVIKPGGFVIFVISEMGNVFLLVTL